VERGIISPVMLQNKNKNLQHYFAIVKMTAES